MVSISETRIFQADLNLFFQKASKKDVRLYLREVAGTHYSRLYVMVDLLEEQERLTWVYEVFSNFSSDYNGRKKSMELAIEDLAQVRFKLQQNGFTVENGKGLDCNNWSPCEVHKTTHYFVENVAVLQK